MNRALTLAVGFALTFGTATASRAASDDLDEAQKAKLEELRAVIANQIQLQAFDLIDELLVGWIEQPVFAAPTPIVLAEVGVPIGYGTGLAALLENHLASVLLANPKTQMVLSHCPQCTAMVVHSGAKGTVVTHGYDDPNVLREVANAASARHALFLDFEAEGSALVLRAKLTSLDVALPVVFARTVSSATSTPALLRAGDRLTTAAEARKEYLDALQGRSALTFPFRMTVRNYAVSGDSPVAAVPFIWVQGGVEVAMTRAQAWLGSFSVGYTWAPESHTGWLAQARLSRLISGSARSLTEPDLYLFTGVSLISIKGLSAALFKDETPDTNTIISQALGLTELNTSFVAWQLGLEARVKNQIGVSVYTESLPGLSDPPALGSYVDLGFVTFRTIGAEVSFCF